MPGDPLTDWKCSECGATFAEAERLRRRRGLPPLLLLVAKACSPECSAARSRRIAGGRNRLPGDPAAWTCSSCRCSLARANRKRFNVGLPPLRHPARDRICLPTCAETMARLNPKARLPRVPSG